MVWIACSWIGLKLVDGNCEVLLVHESDTNARGRRSAGSSPPSLSSSPSPPSLRRLTVAPTFTMPPLNHCRPYLHHASSLVVFAPNSIMPPEYLARLQEAIPLSLVWLGSIIVYSTPSTQSSCSPFSSLAHRFFFLQ